MIDKSKALVMNLLISLMIILFLYGCTSPSQIIGTFKAIGPALKDSKIYKQQQHEKKLIKEGRYEELIQENLQKFEFARKSKKNPLQIDAANKISSAYYQYITDYSKAIEFAELALELIEEGEKLGIENQPDDHFPGECGLWVWKKKDIEQKKRSKTQFYEDAKYNSYLVLYYVYTEVGDSKKATYYYQVSIKHIKHDQKRRAKLQKIYEEQDDKENSKHYADINKLQDKYLEKSYRMLTLAANGDRKGLKNAIEEDMEENNANCYPNIKGIVTRTYCEFFKYIQGADMAYKYGLYQEAYTYVLQAQELYKRYIYLYLQHSKRNDEYYTEKTERKIRNFLESSFRPTNMKGWLIAGRSLNKLGRFSEAIPFLEKAYHTKEVKAKLKFIGPDSQVPKRIEALSELALAYEKEGMFIKAMNSYAELIDYFEYIRGKIISDTHKISFMGLQLENYDHMIRLLFENQRAEKALEYAERSRSRAFIDMLAGKDFQPKSKKIRDLFYKRKSLQYEFITFKQQSPNEVSDERGLQVVKKEMDTISNEIKEKDFEFLSLTTVSPLSAKEIQSLLDPDTALVEYYISKEGLTIWVITSETIKIKRVDIPVWVLADKVMQFRQTVTDPNRQAQSQGNPKSRSQVRLEITPNRFKNGQKYTQRIYAKNNLSLFLNIDKIVKKIGDWTYESAKGILKKDIHEGKEKLVSGTMVNLGKITPGLHQTILNTDQGDLASNLLDVTVDENEMVTIKDLGYSKKDVQSERDLKGYDDLSLYDLLIKPIKPYLNKKRLGLLPHGVLHYLPFAALEYQGRYLVEDYTIFYLPSAAVYKFCQEKRKEFTGPILALGNPDLKDPRLDIPFAIQEVEAISKIFPESKLLFKEEASEAAFKSLAGSYNILHIASHGIFDADRPMNSALLLSPFSKDDGRLTVDEIFDLKLNAAIVTLSACQSGMSRIKAGDEMMGLTRAFIYAGVPSVVATLWNVNDEATSILMEKFYNNLQNTNKADALRNAQLEMTKDERYKKPYLWAAFYLTGDYI